MKNNSNLAYTLLLVVGDFVALLAAFSLAYILRVKIDERPLIAAIPARTYFGALLTVLPFWILVHAFIGLYNQSVFERRFSELGRLLVGAFLGILVVIGYDFVSPAVLFPARLVPIYALGLGFGFLVVSRNFLRYLRITLYRYNVGITNIMIIGDNRIAVELARALKDTHHTGYRVVAMVGDHASLLEFKGVQIFPTFADAREHLKPGSIYSIVQTELFSSPSKNSAILDYAQTNHIAFRFIPGNSDLFAGNIVVELFQSVPMVAVHQTALIGWGKVAKRLFDFVVSLTALLVFSPIILLIAILEIIVGGGLPIFFRQTRITRFNREFRVYKFRTHRNGLSGLTDKQAFAKLGKPELYEKYRDNGYVLDNDPRLSKLGRFLRKTSLDELPQLFNVLTGDISLVGPRPLIPEEINTYDKKHAILSVKSGLTGLAQVSGRSNISFDERRQLDMYYVQNWTFWSDIVILIKTARAVLSGNGAL